MTSTELRNTPHGTKVQFSGASCGGYVVQEHRKKHPDEDVYVQWSDGQRTYAFDEAAVKQISLL